MVEVDYAGLHVDALKKRLDEGRYMVIAEQTFHPQASPTVRVHDRTHQISLYVHFGAMAVVLHQCDKFTPYTIPEVLDMLRRWDSGYDYDILAVRLIEHFTRIKCGT